MRKKDEPIGIIGLGRIGLTAAKAYLNAGYAVIGYDIRLAAMKDLASAGGRAANGPDEVARHASLILILVLNDDQVLSVIHGEKGILQSSPTQGLTLVCMSTIRRQTMENMYRECVKRNINLIDCPFTGGPARIATRTLTLIAAAPVDDLDRVRPVLEVIGKITHAGAAPGMGQAVKHCNQLLVGVTHAATMEVIALSRRLGLDPALVASVAGNGIAGSEYFRLLTESILHQQPSPGGLGQMCKDMSIVRDALRDAGMRGRVAIAAADYFAAALEMGMADREGADLIEVVEKDSRNKSADPENLAGHEH